MSDTGPDVQPPRLERVLDARLPVFELKEVTQEAALAYYKQFQVLHIRTPKLTEANCMQPLSKMKAWHSLHKPIVENSWNIENVGTASADQLDADRVLQPYDAAQPELARFYISCILQSEETEVMDSIRSDLPLHTPPFVGNEKGEVGWTGFSQTSPIWVFLGRNFAGGGDDVDYSKTGTKRKRLTDTALLAGRTEHTDSVSHDGTWHMQCAGSKQWRIRPLKEAAEWAGLPPVIGAGDKGEGADAIHLDVLCEAGDILMINTRLWLHQTWIPETSAAQDGVSLSYARDFFCAASSLRAEEGEPAEVSTEDADYKNVDGLYAVRNVMCGDVVMLESEMPDAELPRTDDPNCEVCETEDGEGCLVAVKDIAAGDWLSVAESEDEDEEDEEEEGGENVDDGEEEEEDESGED
ncbi:hypothetical protein B484DRAFT_174877 [Ochromonadaceae sp. CCMP2298]|nr:hypothetical protein B484DRAFT_174877 [Ochromonadaceae sp. CCMP2298]